MLLLIVLAVLLTAAAGCSRVRTTPGLPVESAGQEQSGETDGKEAQPENGTADSADGDPDVSDSGGAARENPEADRKEYDETADAEIIAGAARTAAGDGAGDAAFSLINGVTECAGRILFPKPLTLIPQVGVWGIWLGTAFTWTLVAAVTYIRFRTGAWRPDRTHRRGTISGQEAC